MAGLNLRDMLLQDEGIKLGPYRDTRGILTIGVGRNLDQVGISTAEAVLMLDNDIQRAQAEAKRRFQWFRSLNGPRQDVVVAMIFNMGGERVAGFTLMAEAIEAGNFSAAGAAMLSSKWAAQVGERAKRMAEIMKTGVYPSTTTEAG